MIEEEIKNIMNKDKISPVDIYKPLKINRINFYLAIKTSNLNNKTLKKILKFLGYDIVVKLKKHDKVNN